MVLMVNDHLGLTVNYLHLIIARHHYCVSASSISRRFSRRTSNITGNGSGNVITPSAKASLLIEWSGSGLMRKDHIKRAVVINKELYDPWLVNLDPGKAV